MRVHLFIQDFFLGGGESYQLRRACGWIGHREEEGITLVILIHISDKKK